MKDQSMNKEILIAFLGSLVGFFMVVTTLWHNNPIIMWGGLIWIMFFPAIVKIYYQLQPNKTVEEKELSK